VKADDRTAGRVAAAGYVDTVVRIRVDGVVNERDVRSVVAGHGTIEQRDSLIVVANARVGDTHVGEWRRAGRNTYASAIR
jgi:hypothetical protein